MKFTTALGLLLICAAAELHPIVEVQTGYFFGAVSGGKWLKAAESAKSGDGEDEVLINATNYSAKTVACR